MPPSEDAISNIRRIPVPVGAVAGDWPGPGTHPEDLMRFLTWSRHDAAGAVVAVEGVQYADGRVAEPQIVVYPGGASLELTASTSRQLAAALLDAADALEGLR
ncbi:hypothetical protein [Mycolicibacterium baixiangningiae]|uniref:hypothetical protein n=1 Tax=Mycolicibacterium baixiangningiae TaxID=2761578 RepID=UPI001D029DA4|nr:hypothetical protein [Mycolicibacterium baixiangningiae]